MRPFYSIALSLILSTGCGTGDGPALPEPLTYGGADSVEAPGPNPPSSAEVIPSSDGTLPRAEKEPQLPSLIPAPTPEPDKLAKNNPPAPAPTPVPPAPQEPAPQPPPPQEPLPQPAPVPPEPEEPIEEEEAPEPVQGPDVIDEDGRSIPDVISTPDDPEQPTQEQFAAMLASGKVVSRYDIRDADSWGTSPERRIEVFVAVDGAGRPLVPSDVRDTQVDGGIINFLDKIFETVSGRPVRSVHSVLKICNRSPRDLLLRTSNGQHITSARRRIDVGECSQFLVENANAFVDGQSVQADRNPRTTIFFKLTKVGLDGRIIP